MKSKQTLSYSFYCKDPNNGKYDILEDKSYAILDFKNHLSLKICDTPKNYIHISGKDMITAFRPEKYELTGNTYDNTGLTILELCNNQDISNAIQDVHVAYANKRETFLKKTSCKVQESYGITYYLKNTKSHKKGDVRATQIIMKDTPLSKAVTYLAKYYNEGLIDFLRNNQISDKNLIAVRQNVLHYVDKYGDRIIKLAVSVKERMLKKTFEFPIEFVSDTFTSCTEQKQNIINKNKRTTSDYNAYITIPGQPSVKGGKLTFPVKQSNKHHGSLKHYYKEPNKKGQRNTTYTVCFEANRTLRFILTREKEVEIVTNKPIDNAMGFDVNIKHNMLCGGNGFEQDYDKGFIVSYAKFLNNVDVKIKRKKAVNPEDNKISNKDRKKRDKFEARLNDMQKRKASEVIKHVKSCGSEHVVLEDITQFGKTFGKMEEFEGFKVSRLVKIMRLGDIKNIIESIGNKNGVQTTLVQSHYTSQGCKCGCIDSKNRTTQEKFECVDCGYTENADTHSVSMIEDRLKVDVLRKSLLNYKDGLYRPKKLSKDSIKKILMECYDNSSQATKVASEYS